MCACVCACSLVLTLIACGLFVTSLATPSIISTSGFGSIQTQKLSGDFGPFRVCYTIGNEHHCETIDADCRFTVTLFESMGLSLGASITQDIPVVDKCSSWNAARGFLVLAGQTWLQKKTRTALQAQLTNN